MDFFLSLQCSVHEYIKKTRTGLHVTPVSRKMVWNYYCPRVGTGSIVSGGWGVFFGTQGHIYNTMVFTDKAVRKVLCIYVWQSDLFFKIQRACSSVACAWSLEDQQEHNFWANYTTQLKASSGQNSNFMGPC